MLRPTWPALHNLPTPLERLSSAFMIWLDGCSIE